MHPFQIIALTPAGVADARLVVAADRAGCLGIINAEIGALPYAVLDTLRGRTREPFGLKLGALDDESLSALESYVPGGLGWLVVDASIVLARPEVLQRMVGCGLRVVVEAIEWDDRLATLSGHHALQVKGHEAGGLIGEETSFILLQKALERQAAPVLVRGGVGLHGTAAVRAVGAAGVVLDDQLLLLKESSVSAALQAPLRDFTGLETGLIQVGDKQWRVFDKPGFQPLRQMRQTLSATLSDKGTERLIGALGWADPSRQLVPLGQAAAYAKAFADRFSTMGRLAQGLLAESERWLSIAVALDPLGGEHGVAASHGTKFPIVQGPMTRVTDVAGFAQDVADAGALPLLALALMQPEAVEKLLRETRERLAGKPWGIGVLGFAPSELIAEQVKVALRYAPRFALIAGGRPEQAKELEGSGITSYLHVPSPGLLTMFLERGARRFVFEGRECGGHVGPLSSMVLWDIMISTLLRIPADPARDAEIQVLFAGGVHDARSAAIVSAMAAPLAERGMKIGVLMGTAYLFTWEIVRSRAIVPEFQNAAIACTKTVTLETGPGHASRAAVSPFAREFLARRRKLEAEKLSGDAVRENLEELSLGRLRMASKGQERAGPDNHIRAVPPGRQWQKGMYMLGQVATLRQNVETVADLHRSVSVGAHQLLEARLVGAAPRGQILGRQARPADIAIIGMAGIFPKAESIDQLWDNILDKVDAIVEIPRERWDYRLYFDEDRASPDRIYSRWGGFLNDLLFDPVRYGIPPRALKAVDPLQLMTLEVVRRCLADAGLENATEVHERTSVILGASGGAGDVGAQYAVRAEMPRFLGTLAPQAAGRLPQWTEDSFAGILLNVAAGRTANRFNFGGLNYTTDAACASSLSAVYQSVLELETGRSDVVITGGIDTVQGPFGYLCFSKTQALSPRGRCRAFDATADGIVISEGIAVVALKRLADAERDGDRIYAVIKGVGGSSDGRAKSMTAPHSDGQIRALSRAYEMAGYSPASVGLFEAHGTGTVAGDTAELETVTRLLAQSGAGPNDHPIGSIKSFIGHTKATAGIAGLIKAALACYHKVLPPHADVEAPNKKLAERGSPLYLVNEAQPWFSRPDAPRRAAVSAFGFGGTNFHVTLEEHKQGLDRDPAARQRWSRELLIWRGADRAALAAAVRRTADRLTQGAQPLLRDLAYALAQKAAGSGITAALVVGTNESVAERVAALADHVERPDAPLPPGGFFSESPLIAGGGKLALIFPGQGAQYVGMFRELAMLFPEMRAILERADAKLSARMFDKGVPNGDLSRAVFARAVYDDAARAAAAERLTRTDIAQPALGAIEAGLLAVLKRLGLRADMAAGHSYGEFVALYAAGVMTLEELLIVSEARGRFMIEAAAGRDLGTMAAVQAERRVVENAIAGMADVWVANHNAPLQTVISGTKVGVATAGAYLERLGLSYQPISVGAAFHSPVVAPAAEPLAELIRLLPLNAPNMAVYSNCTASVYPGDVAGLRAVLAEHLVSPVQFVTEIEAMYADGARVFVSIGPRGAQASMIRQILGDKPYRVVVCDDGTGGLNGFLQSIAALLAEGADLDVVRLWRARDCRLLDDSLVAAPRGDTPAPHMWLLNGSGARPFGAPPLPVLTLEEVAELRIRAVAPTEQVAEMANDAAAPSNAHSRFETKWPSPNAARSRGSRSVPPFKRRAVRKEMKVMTSDEPASDRETALVEFQSTMQRFLELQERIMLAYLTDGESMERNARPILPPIRPPALPVGPRQMTGLPQHVARLAAAAKASGARAATAAQGQPHPAAQNGSAAPSAAPVNGGPRPHGTASNGAPYDRAALTDHLISLVEDRTGYARDMLGMDHNLEADLGIDSIKRVEIVGALLKWLPAELQSKMADVGEALNRQKTLNGILDLLWSKIGNEAGVPARPFDVTGADIAAATACARPPRFLMVAHAENLPPQAPTTLPAGVYVITDDGAGLAAALAELVEAAGGRAKIVPAEPEVFRAKAGKSGDDRVVGFIHLAPFGAQPIAPNSDPSAWRAALIANELFPHQFVRHFSSLQASGRILLVSGLGGAFGRGASAGVELRVAGGGPALAKTLREEWPDIMAKAVDLPRDRSVRELAVLLFAELAVAGGRIEVGYPDGRRTVFRTEAADIDLTAASRDALPDGAVILATGGARGITAEVLHTLARPGVTLWLAGRSSPAPEDPALAELKTNGALRAHLIAQARAASQAPRPRDIEKQMQAILRNREVSANIAELRAAGAEVIYRVADVRNLKEATTLAAEIYARHGRLDGVIHGAGLIEDKMVVDKDAESWLRVVETKALSAITLAQAVKPESLRFFFMFGSVAGRFGNSGQADYGVANELLNRFAWQLRALWPQAAKVAVLNWGPWLGTRHGTGMVSQETRRKFEAKGVQLIEPNGGALVCREEILHGPIEDVEIVVGEGPWEKHETDQSTIHISGVAASAPLPSLPLLAGVAVRPGPRGRRNIVRTLSLEHDLYLDQHRIDSVPVLPAAVALEFAAEAAAAVWPQWCVAEVTELRLLKGLLLEGDKPRAIEILVLGSEHGDASGFKASVEIRSVGEKGQPHYRASLRLTDALPESEAPGILIDPGPAPLTARQAYREVLFHGPCLQVVHRLVGFDSTGIVADVVGSAPHALLRHAGPQDRWLFDPALVDAAAQLAWLWSSVHSEAVALPNRFAMVRRFTRAGLARKLVLRIAPETRWSPQVRAEVLVLDEAGRVVFAIDELESTASPALNRLRGWSGKIRV
jgi:acyl transferase domain-containing protein/NAD(P)H-dependent flavin oxidoreductase YrpB (nitropropane dioxygenase family)/NAD(P)-dependent dehydrogenase (short-subunit alcohol dehydrogenase family)